MTTYRVKPYRGAPVLRHAASIKRAIARGLREFPAGLQSVEAVSVRELAALAAAGMPLPASARQRVEVYTAVQRVQVKAAAKAEAIRDKARKTVRAKREEERARREALKAQKKAEGVAEKKRPKTAERRAQPKAERKAEKLQQQALPAVPVLGVGVNDTRLPWE